MLHSQCSSGFVLYNYKQHLDLERLLLQPWFYDEMFPVLQHWRRLARRLRWRARSTIHVNLTVQWHTTKVYTTNQNYISLNAMPVALEACYGPFQSAPGTFLVLVRTKPCRCENALRGRIVPHDFTRTDDENHFHCIVLGETTAYGRSWVDGVLRCSTTRRADSVFSSFIYSLSTGC